MVAVVAAMVDAGMVVAVKVVIHPTGKVLDASRHPEIKHPAKAPLPGIKHLEIKHPAKRPETVLVGTEVDAVATESP